MFYNNDIKRNKITNTRLIQDKDSPDFQPLCSRNIDCGKQRFSINAILPWRAFWKFIGAFLFSKIVELHIILLFSFDFSFLL